MKRLAVLVLALAGCAPPLTPLQRSALLQRVRDQGAVATAAIRARDEARDEMREARGLKPIGYDRATLDFVQAENADLVASVNSSLR